MNTTHPIPYVLADPATGPAITHPQVPRGFAILLPDGRLWREPIHYARDPHDTTPDIWPTRAAATTAKRELVTLLVGTYGALGYTPSVVQVELSALGDQVRVITAQETGR